MGISKTLAEGDGRIAVKQSCEQLEQLVRELETELTARKESASPESCAPESENQCRQMVENFADGALLV